MSTKIRPVHLSDEVWAGLRMVAATVVPDHEVAPKTNAGTSRVAPMLRMIAAGKLVVVKPEEVCKSSD